MKPPLTIYLNRDRTSALLQFIVDRSGGSLEVPITYPLWRRATELPDTMTRFPRATERYYVGGGSHWPLRTVIEEAA
ncbi:hypothetical protein ASC80_01630 [Afipia sp. Root123D2]|uniref:hypothetical protein n=1 Tax=Afipia sp. Root123D2 TaxID=1736436 RepID=UPI0006F7205C|nr:hypothetical protein [Afipia sp. Root123D2]KQW22123.1 hypothetical protein ASC80_01630 [Afipia sp. Root123D2]